MSRIVDIAISFPFQEAEENSIGQDANSSFRFYHPSSLVRNEEKLRSVSSRFLEGWLCRLAHPSSVAVLVSVGGCFFRNFPLSARVSFSYSFPIVFFCKGAAEKGQNVHLTANGRWHWMSCRRRRRSCRWGPFWRPLPLASSSGSISIYQIEIDWGFVRGP